VKLVPSRLRRGEIVAAVGAIVLLVAMFTGWYGLTLTLPVIGTADLHAPATDAWDAFTVVDLILALAAATALSLALAQAAFHAPAVPVALSVVGTVLGGISIVAILFRIADPPGIGLPANLPRSALAVTVHLHRSVEAGAWVGLAGAVMMTVGCWRSVRTEGVLAADEHAEVETIELGGAPRQDPGAP
jgi:hypothetical protein